MTRGRARGLGWLVAACVAATLVGCATWGDAPPLSLHPRGLAQAEPIALFAGRPTVALALGGGGLRGYAHLGVLRALDEAGVQPDIVVGTSVGAVVGAAYASGRSPEALLASAREVKLSSLIDLSFSSGGLMRGRHIAAWVEQLIGGLAIEAFPRRFAAVATDLQSGAAVLLDSGPAGAAVQASAAVPGVNVPVAYAGGHLVDGGISGLVPVRAARALGADVVIAVDIYCRGPRAEGLGALSVLGRSMQTQNCLAAAPETAEADVLIAPAVKVSGLSAKDEQEAAIEAGYAAARAALPLIRMGMRGAGPCPGPACFAKPHNHGSDATLEASSARPLPGCDAGAAAGSGDGRLCHARR